MVDPLRAIASDLSYQVFERRRLKGELGPCALDSTNRRLYGVPSQTVVREAFIADREPVPDSFQGETPRFVSER
jgi:hypothetical protein